MTTPHFEPPTDGPDELPLQSVDMGRACAEVIVAKTYEEEDEEVVPNILFSEASSLLMAHAVALCYEMERQRPDARNATRNTLLGFETMLNYYLKKNQYPLTVSVTLKT